MKLQKTKRVLLTSLLAIAVAVGLSACGSSSSDDSDSSSGGGNNSKFVGTWALGQGGGTDWYIHFGADNSWNISNNADGSGRRVFGTYTVSGNTARGPMQNPGTGVGEIVAVLESDTTLGLDFIEHWHTPHKVIHYNSSKL